MADKCGGKCGNFWVPSAWQGAPFLWPVRKQLWPTSVVANAAMSTTFSGASAAVDYNCGGATHIASKPFCRFYGPVKLETTRRGAILGAQQPGFGTFAMRILPWKTSIPRNTARHADMTMANSNTPKHGAMPMGHAGGAFVAGA